MAHKSDKRRRRARKAIRQLAHEAEPWNTYQAVKRLIDSGELKWLCDIYQELGHLKGTVSERMECLRYIGWPYTNT